MTSTMDQSKEPEKFNVGGAGRLLLKVDKDKLQSLKLGSRTD